MAQRTKILGLYAEMLRTSKQFHTYNFREYALRVTQQRFRENKSLSDPDSANKLVEEAQKQLELLRRQVVINSMYAHKRLVIEDPQAMANL
eukprot:CAMPEP_0177649258 /NCGR_PEP_ID=MMETSP0447-20121125/11282_1 /TAXON_ID=0 /ORGANISM="Stygamoeba regulata, Strain BSH-02190019" /LENGTH=90 /DNA_ID=CAMNT_0019151987 /DNA_START=217 /DNA_END=489 /DNA_ORIENTATION=+